MVTLGTVGLPCESLDPVPVSRFFEIPFTNTNTKLKGRFASIWCSQVFVIQAIGLDNKRFSFFKKVIDQFSMLQPFSPPQFMNSDMFLFMCYNKTKLAPFRESGAELMIYHRTSHKAVSITSVCFQKKLTVSSDP
jgi:hypothetical protein